MFYGKAIWTTDHLTRLGITTNLLIGAYLTPSRLIASLCYKNRCYTQNFVRVNGCCWWILFVCLWLICYRPSVYDPSWFKKLPHNSFFLKLQPMIHSLGVIILAWSSTSSKHRFYKLFWQSRIPLILSQIVNMVTSSSLYLFDLIPWPSGKTSQFLMRVTPMQFSSFIFQNYCMSPQATSLGTFVSMHNFAQRNGTPSVFYQVVTILVILLELYN